jgi:uncharacterized membrane protein YeaQ/YmgE (transglycosylase-associated protein family)
MASVGAQIFWIITIGLILGYISYFLHYESDLAVNLVPSILIGMTGALVGGGIAFLFGFYLPSAFAILGSIGFLFIINAFRQKHDWKQTPKLKN